MGAERLCATCKFWSDEEPWGRPPRFRSCERMISGANKPYEDTTLAFAIDVESYHAEVVTRDDFGCVMWESHHEPTPIVRIVNIDGDLVPYVPRP